MVFGKRKRSCRFDWFRNLIGILLFASIAIEAAGGRITDRDSAAKHFDYVFKGKVIGDSTLPVSGELIFPYYMITKRITFEIDTLYKGSHVDSFTVEYSYSADTCEEKPTRFSRGDIYEIGVSRGRGLSKFVPFVTRRSALVERPYTVKGDRYVRLKRTSYIKYLGHDLENR